VPADQKEGSTKKEKKPYGETVKIDKPTAASQGRIDLQDPQRERSR